MTGGEEVKSTTPIQSKQKDHHLPGGPLIMRPLRIGDKYFDPYHPPKLHKTPDGPRYIGGIEIDERTAYNMLFWSKQRPEGTREAMEQNIDSAATTGTFSHFAGFTERAGGQTELDEPTKEKVYAYCTLAEEMGYIVGPFNLNKNSGTVTATISKK